VSTLSRFTNKLTSLYWLALDRPPQTTSCNPWRQNLLLADVINKDARRGPVSCPCPWSCRFARLIEIVQVFVFFRFDIDPFHRMVRPPARLEARPIRDRYRRQCFECLDQAKASVRSIPGRRGVFRRCPDRIERVPFLVDRMRTEWPLIRIAEHVEHQ
jgi:hypothetical protein